MINAEKIFIDFLKEKNTYERFLAFINYDESCKNEYFSNFRCDYRFKGRTYLPYRAMGNILYCFEHTNPKNDEDFRMKEILFWEEIAMEWEEYVWPKINIYKYVYKFYGNEIWFKMFVRFLKEHDINISNVKLDFSFILKCNLISELGYCLKQDSYVQHTKYPGWFLMKVWEKISNDAKLDELYNLNKFKHND